MTPMSPDEDAVAYWRRLKANRTSWTDVAGVDAATEAALAVADRNQATLQRIERTLADMLKAQLEFHRRVYALVDAEQAAKRLEQ